MESSNGFKKGLNKDVNPLNQPKDTYKDALNIRLVNDADSTTLSANNIKGNVLSTTIPDSPLIQRVDITGTTASNLTIAGQVGAGFTTSGSTGEDLYNYLVNDGNYTNLGVTYNVYYHGNHIVVVPISPNAAPTITASTADLTVNSGYVPSQSNLEVIGSVTIRDDIYLFTTNNTSKNPGGHSPDSSLPVNGPSIGQIWKMTYDKVSLAVPTLTLIYSNYIDFSTYYAIPPSATLGRYENSTIQRIYWTDNFNKLRSLNVADSNSLALDPTILDITPAADFDIPKLQSLEASSGNNLKVGVIQCAYRLKNTGGAVTTFSALSNVVTLVTRTESTQVYGGGSTWAGYTGSNAGTAVSKVITWQIDNLDRDFDRIEVAIIFRDSLTSTPIIEVLDDVPITGDSHTVVYDGTQDTIEITLSEFLALSGSFTHCKTIETKDNRLFAGNIRNQLSEIDFDARAFRAKTSGADDIYLTNNGSTTVHTSAQAQALTETEDAINPYGTANEGLYKPNTAILGGAGANISYEFYTVAVAADIERTPGDTFDVPNDTAAPWRFTYSRSGQTSVDLGVLSPTNQAGTSVQSYPTLSPGNIINDGWKYPQFNGLFRGYQRNEIYRFGIQFYDKSKNPYFVKWIGDIKFPDYSDSNPNSYYEDSSATGITDFRPSFVANPTHASDEVFVQSLGIEFTVTIPDDVADVISGYSIVRVAREDKDKTIICEGFHNPINIADYDSMDNNYYMTNLNSDPSGLYQADNSGTSKIPFKALDKGFFVTPNINNPALVAPSENMTFKLKGQMVTSNTTKAVTFAGGDPYYFYKLYGWNSTVPATYEFNIDQITPIVYGGQTTDTSTSKTVFNYDYDVDDGSNADDTTSTAMGNHCYYYRLDAAIDYASIYAAGSRFLVSIERSLVSQYGGATYVSRSNNTYMSCSMFKPVRTRQQTATPDMFIVFGGDTYVNMYDSCRWAKNWGVSGRGLKTSGPGYEKTSNTIFFPCSSPINTDLRHGVYMNKDMSATYDTGADFIETYVYNPIYSATNNIREFFPKPDPFILNEEFDNRIYASEIKINGEFIDSWGTFLVNNYWDVEGSYGGINAITALKGEVYGWQDSAFFKMSINPRVLITDSGNDAEIQLGTGNVLQRHDYISIKDGLQHQWGMTKSKDKLYWVDINKKKFFSYSGQGLLADSDVKGMLSWFNSNLKNLINTTDKPVYNDITAGVSGVRAVYHDKYEQAIFTFTDGSNEVALRKSFTLVYDDMINAFSSFFSHIPKVYITDGYKVFSTDPTSLSDIYMHDEGSYGVFYGTAYPTTIKLVVNDNYPYTKVFDNIMYDSQSLQYSSTYDNYQNDFLDTWESIRVYNDHQNTDFQTIALNAGLKRKERTWNLQIPRNRVLYTANPSPNIFDPTELSSPNNKTFGERMRDKYIIVDLLYNNNTNRLLSCNNFRVNYRASAR